ncbi:von Willebrand factor A domain-containing protein 5B1-like [Saccoglossus kowalevskii]|uniref:von Willebrand factor A domain-containing protein 5B1-like n=1 Tax=Saccoglossus kowalevskii TaxID=10224 RepID=A0ABM0GUD1_SACKO|nr:PREDICTED: von Willebrand factor A domain-containing protein 5B1-like [Saccoglossus kowalevskii]
MPGLINRHTRNPLPLHNCRITGCVNGYSAGITAYLTYCNDEDHLVDGLYVMPTTEFSTVVAFEAQVYGRNYTASIREKSKCECVLSETPSITSGHMCLNQGKFVINEFDETRVFAATVGTIPPFGTVTLLISVVFELEITKDGALLFKLPSVFTPRFSPPILPDQTSLISFSYTGPDERAHANSLGSLLEIATDIPLNTIKYEFEFQLEIKAPGLLSGVSSSTHSIRVDADPLAVDASDVFVTLAEPHDFKKDFRMMIYLAKPHEPSVVIELGDMTGTEYVEFLKTTEDFSNLDNKEDKTIDKDRVTKLRNRLHRDIMHVPVIMLNYSPDFRELEDTLNKKFEVPSEFIFVIDRSGSMSGANIANARETLMLFMKSLPMTCQFNIIGFGSSFKPLFECSRPYTQVTISECSQYITKMKADMGGTNLFSPLEWIYKKPICRGFPRHVFVLTDGTVNNVQQVIELVKNNSHNTR